MPSIRLFIRQRITLIIAGLLACIIIVGWWLASAPAAEPADFVDQQADMLPIADEVPTPLAPTAAPPVIAYVSGAVQSPDVYQLPAGARIKDLVVAAGGFASNADPERINLAERVNDGQHIRVPRQGEPDAPAADTQAQQAGASGADTSIIDINTASAAELDSLEGIGQVLAQRIVEYRTANGPFKSVDELDNVDGISTTLLGKLAPQLRVGP